MKGELVDRARAVAQVFKLAHEERDAWINWPARVAVMIVAELSPSSSEAAGQTINRKLGRSYEPAVEEPPYRIASAECVDADAAPLDTTWSRYHR